jgi:hypothetical protein
MKFKIIIIMGLIVVLFMLPAGPVLADGTEGRIEFVYPADQSFVVQGITFYVTLSTDYDDGLRSFADLRPGQKVEVDFKYREGKHYATEIELED